MIKYWTPIVLLFLPGLALGQIVDGDLTCWTSGGYDQIPTFCIDSNFVFYQDQQFNVEWHLNRDIPFVQLTSLYEDPVTVHFLDVSRDTITVRTNGVKKTWYNIKNHNKFSHSIKLMDSIEPQWVYFGLMHSIYHHINITENKVYFDLETWNYKYIFLPQQRRERQNIILERGGEYRLFRITNTNYSRRNLENYRVTWGDNISSPLQRPDDLIKNLDQSFNSFLQHTREYPLRYLNTQNSDYIEFNNNYLEISTQGVHKKFGWETIVSEVIDHLDGNKMIKFQFYNDTMEADLFLKADPLLGYVFGRSDKGKFVQYQLKNSSSLLFYYKPSDTLFLHNCDFPPHEILKKWTFDFNQSNHYLDLKYSYFEIDQTQFKYLKIERYQNGYLIFGKSKIWPTVIFLSRNGQNWEIIYKTGWRPEKFSSIPLLTYEFSELSSAKLSEKFKGEWKSHDLNHILYFQPEGILLNNRFWQIEEAPVIDTQKVQLNLFDEYDSKSIIIKADHRNRFTWFDRNNLEEPIIHFKKVINFWYWLIPSIATGLLILWLLVKYLRTKSFLKKATRSRQLAESKLNGLRAQMNPHFVFNAIGSIQHLMYQQNPKAAITYLTSLSGMLRQVLNLSTQNFVSLKEEINYLEKYLKLEQLRYPFTYHIDSPENPEVEIPSMMIQPVVENAIIHGIRHLDHSEGWINIQVKVNHDQVTWSIKDNGIGVAASQQIKDQSISGHRSKALDNLRERMQLLNTIYQTGLATLTIKEWQDESGESGTIVHIQLPIAL